jgi:hypothetical protein
MNMNNKFQTEIAVLSKVLDRSIITINSKYYNRLSSKIMPTQINMFIM